MSSALFMGRSPASQVVVHSISAPNRWTPANLILPSSSSGSAPPTWKRLAHASNRRTCRLFACGINRTLLLTKTGQNGQSGSAQRFAETMQWALSVITDDGLLPQGPDYGSTLHVRLIHAFVRRHVAGPTSAIRIHARPQYRRPRNHRPFRQLYRTRSLTDFLTVAGQFYEVEDWPDSVRESGIVY
ncbi:DUF2236 domain-containing protein [Mycobacteroides franklinii]|uniref:DUF2236 domain-containing protein n=1 Tax=Mycobacteroides franklinii TaxID=948102 RepID=A0A4R5P8R7_9MYCO|nr:DUF2236 domain-containing protein [Mycobacteroides franklinii]